MKEWVTPNDQDTPKDQKPSYIKSTAKFTALALVWVLSTGGCKESNRDSTRNTQDTTPSLEVVSKKTHTTTNTSLTPQQITEITQKEFKRQTILAVMGGVISDIEQYLTVPILEKDKKEMQEHHQHALEAKKHLEDRVLADLTKEKLEAWQLRWEKWRTFLKDVHETDILFWETAGTSWERELTPKEKEEKEAFLRQVKKDVDKEMEEMEKKWKEEIAKEAQRKMEEEKNATWWLPNIPKAQIVEKRWPLTGKALEDARKRLDEYDLSK